MKVYYFSILIFYIVPNLLIAQQDIFIGNTKISLGSDMTELQAIELAKIQTEKEASEKAGIYIQSKIKIENNILIENIVTTFSAEVMKLIDFRHKIEIEGNSIVLIASGKYQIDINSFNKRLNQLSKEKKLENELQKMKEKYSDLIFQISKANDYENRKKLINNFKELKEKSKNLIIGRELSLINKRIEGLKDELIEKLYEIEKYFIENSDFNITDKKILADSIKINIAYKRIYNKKFDRDLEEILQFYCEKKMYESKEYSQFFNFYRNPSLKLNCYDHNNKIIFSVSIPIFSLDLSMKGRTLPNGITFFDVWLYYYGPSLTNKNNRITENILEFYRGTWKIKIMQLSLSKKLSTEGIFTVSIPNLQEIEMIKLEY